VTHKALLTAGLLLVAPLAACGDPFEPIRTPVPQPEETALHDFENGNLLDPSAFDLFNGTAVRTDLSSAWDLLFSVDPSLGPTLMARGAVLGGDFDAGIQVSTSAFDDLTEAPEDNYTDDVPVPISVGDVLIVRSRQSTRISFRCRLFGKMEIVSIEGSPAVATIRYVINPNCEQRGIEPEV
jgi:hypothetical protein